jgi:hypothetical protein
MELKNIKYQTMLLNNNSKIFETKPNVLNIEKFLDNEKQINKNKPWSKLNKGTKIKLVTKYAEEYQEKNKITDEQKKNLIDYLKLCLERRKLNKKQDLTYDKENFKIVTIQNLVYNKVKNRFTLKKSDKRVSSLKSLAPKNKTKKHLKDKKEKQKRDKIKKQKRDKIKKKKPTTISEEAN